MKTDLTQNPEIRVASYNVHRYVGLDRRTMPERVLSVISEVEADIVALQEADMREGRRYADIPRELIEKHTDMAPVELAASHDAIGWHGNMILARKGTKVTAKDHLRLPSSPFEQRGAILMELEHRGRCLRIVATHLGLARRHRRNQLQTIAEQVSRRAAMPTVIMGDFNEWSRKQGLEAIEKDFSVHVPGRSFHAARPIAALDRIATSAGLALRNAGVHERGDALKASDHLPVWADLAVDPDF